MTTLVGTAAKAAAGPGAPELYLTAQHLTAQHLTPPNTMSPPDPNDPDADAGAPVDGDSLHGALSDPAPGMAGTSRHTLSRRKFLGWTAAGGAVAAVVAVAVVTDSSSKPGPTSSTGTSGTNAAKGSSTTTTAPHATRATVDGVSLPTSRAIIAENARTGTAWWVTTAQNAGDIEGYADHVSAQVGDTVTLRVNTKATTFHVEAFRMGYYQGIGARRVWQSAEVPGVRQAPPSLIQPTNTIECAWTPSIQIVIGQTWPPGTYLLKLVGATGEQGFVPLCIRDDASTSAILLMEGVTSWQAYNRWGGYSLYYGNKAGALSYIQTPGGGTYANRARIVSFDRPYSHDWASGATDFVGNELPVVFQAEQLGLDISYWTDIDLHERPQLLANHRVVLSMGHDEYWSAPMRNGVQSAVAKGLNVAFLGANACYRQIRLEPSPLGADRHVVCYKSAAEDPMTGKDNSVVTVNWNQSPVNNPESQLTGATYQDIDAQADVVIVDPKSWLLAGTGLTAGQHLPHAMIGEFDRYTPGPSSPNNVDIIAHSVIPNRKNNYADITWYTVSGGGGVLDTGNASWIGQMSNAPLIPSNVLPAPVPGVTDHLLRIMLNVYSVLGTAPASTTNPSTGTWRAVYDVPKNFR